MDNSNTHHQRIAKMGFALVYPMYLAKVKKKGRTKEELLQIIQWLTGLAKSQCKPYHRGNLRLSGRGNRESAKAAFDLTFNQHGRNISKSINQNTECTKPNRQ
jgi:hypothetical protein